MHLHLYNLKENPRNLVRHVLHAGELHALTLIDASDSYLSITPFDCETANTVFLDATMLLLDANAASPEKLARLQSAANSIKPYDLATLNGLISHLQLYCNQSATHPATQSTLAFLLK